MSHTKLQGRSLIVGAGLVVLGCLVGISATLLFTMSPQQAASLRAVPQLPVPTTQVMKQVLIDSTDAPCSYSAVVSNAVAPVSAGQFRMLVVTSITVSPGDSLVSGTVVGSVSGHLIIVFTSTVPFFRDLRVGDRGADVKALQEGLVAAGMLSKADGVFDEATHAVMKRIYREAGLASTDGFDLDSAWAVPPDSKVVSVLVGVGDVVDTDTTLISAQSGDGNWTCQVPPALAISVGGKLEATVDDQSMDVTVVGQGVDSETGMVTVTVSLPQQAGADSSVTVTVVSRQSAGAVLSVPAGAIFTNAGGDTEVRVVRDGQMAPVPVRIGIVAGGWVEIIGDGIAEGDTVQLREPG